MTLLRPHRGPTRRALVSALGVLGVLVAVAAAGCDRQPRFVPASADSSLVRPDSFAVAVERIHERWEDPAAGEEAARLTATLLRVDLQRLAGEGADAWAGRARELLDSLDVGADLAEAPCALVVNLFARSNPGGGAWPWLFTCAGDGVRAQAIEGRGMTLSAAAARGLRAGTAPSSAAGIAVLYGRRAASGVQPMLMTWRPRKDAWDLAQTLGADSLGGFGNGGFEAASDSDVVLVTRTWRAVPRFQECATCPHVVWTHRFRWSGAGFTRVSDEVMPSPYASFVRFVQALGAGDRDAAVAESSDPALVDRAIAAGWNETRGAWRVAPSTAENAREMVFLRGNQEAWRVRFDRRGPQWAVAGFEATSRSVE